MIKKQNSLTQARVCVNVFVRLEVGEEGEVGKGGVEDQRQGSHWDGWMGHSSAESCLGRRRVLGLTLPTAWSQ